MKIGDVEISYDVPPVFVAELSCNHKGSLAKAIQLIENAKDARASLVKFQCYDPDAMTRRGITIEDGPWKGRDLYDLYIEAQTPFDWFPILAEVCETLGMPWFASVFDTEGIDVLESVDCPMYKIASCELVDIDLIQAVARTGKPVVMSTGMASREDIARAVRAWCAYSNQKPILLHCIAGYPSQPQEAQLRTIAALKNAGTLVGISDHTRFDLTAIAATTLGVVMIEKHLKLEDYWEQDEAGKWIERVPLDAEFSLEPHDFRVMVDRCRQIWDAIHDHTLRIDTGPVGSEVSTFGLRRSLRALDDIPKGAEYTRQNVGALRPNGGLPPWRIGDALGSSAPRDIKAGEPILESDLLKG